MKLKILLLAFLIILFVLFSNQMVFAQAILPAATQECEEVDQQTGRRTGRPTNDFKQVLANEISFQNDVRTGGADRLSAILGCAIKLGRVRMYMIPFFITYLIKLLLDVAGLIAVLFVVIGGYKYVVGGITEDKESGKKTIMHALVGLVIALSAWIVVNFIQVALTS